MQPRSALRIVACGVWLAAATAAPAPAAIGDAEAPSDCRAPSGLVANQWRGPTQSGRVALWDDPANWSLGDVPGPGDTHQVVCVRTAARVVIPRRAHLRVRIAALHLGGTPEGPGQVVVLRRNGLFVEASPKQVISTVATGSKLKLKGAALGGAGRLEVRGQLVLDAAGDRANVVTTRPCGTHCPRRTADHGTVAVVAGGSLKVNRGLTTVTDGMHVVVGGGELTFRGEAGRVVADDGTRLALRPHSADPQQPALRFLNNGGWYAGADLPRRGPTRVRIHGAVLTKERGVSTSSIQGDVRATEPVQVRIDTGTLAIEGIDTKRVTSDLEAGSSLSTGSCAAGDEGNGCEPTATPVGQAATLRLPDNGVATGVSITNKPAAEASLGRAVVVRGEVDVTRAEPAVLELRYAADVAGGRTPDTTAVAMTRKKEYRNLGPCTAEGQIPRSTGACVDRRPDQSRIEPSTGELVMVVRTRHFSRYICR